MKYYRNDQFKNFRQVEKEYSLVSALVLEYRNIWRLTNEQRDLERYKEYDDRFYEIREVLYYFSDQIIKMMKAGMTNPMHVQKIESLFGKDDGQ